jgi:hypothetical protein
VDTGDGLLTPPGSSAAASVDQELGAGQEPELVGRQEHDHAGHALGPGEPAEHRDATAQLVGAEILILMLRPRNAHG